MTRLIKFRFFKNGSWYFLDFSNAQRWATDVLQHMSEEGISVEFDYPPQQFTGLHDKNGVEIYEGDILKGAPSGWKKEFQIFYLAEVYFGDCGWRAKEKLLDRELPIHIHMQGSCGVEVIGNVYENPELLEGKK